MQDWSATQIDAPLTSCMQTPPEAQDPQASPREHEKTVVLVVALAADVVVVVVGGGVVVELEPSAPLMRLTVPFCFL